MTFLLVVTGISVAVIAALLLGLRARPDNRLRGLAGVGTFAIPLGAVAVYLAIGSRGFIDPQASLDDGDTLISLLERQVASQPDLPGPLMNLAQALDEAGRPVEAATLWRRAAALGGDEQADALAHAAQSLIMANEGTVTAEAAALIAEALAVEPAHLPARFYAGLAELQTGQPADALATWSSLLTDLPPDAEFRPMVESGIREAAARANLPSPLPDATPQLPDDAQIRAMVDGLAARLAENPDDLEGWKRLGRSRRVLNQFNLSHEAYLRAVALAPEDPEALAGAAEALTLGSEDPAEPPEEALILFRRVLDVDPDHALALYVVGEAAARQDDKDTARAMLGRLLQRIPPDEPMRQAIADRLEQLDLE
jgi:cytochrome c-type biogenesis protein CcmH